MEVMSCPCVTNFLLKYKQAILSADIVVLMSKGRVKLVGSPADLASCPDFSAHTALSPLLPVQDQEKSVESKEDFCEEEDCIQISSEAEGTIDLEERKEGNVELVVYRSTDSSVFSCLKCSASFK